MSLIDICASVIWIIYESLFSLRSVSVVPITLVLGLRLVHMPASEVPVHKVDNRAKDENGNDRYQGQDELVASARSTIIALAVVAASTLALKALVSFMRALLIFAQVGVEATSD